MGVCHEVEKVDLVARKPWLVPAETDALCTMFRGAVFERGSARFRPSAELRERVCALP